MWAIAFVVIGGPTPERLKSMNESETTKTDPIQLSVVVPCYNEEEVLAQTTAALSQVLESMVAQGKISADSGVFYVDDGSKDKTWNLIKQTAHENKMIHGLKLSRNRGHQVALLAGLLNAPGDAIVSIDADLQDDVQAIEKMVDQFLAGSDIVYGVRSQRTTDTMFKRITARGFYQCLATMGVDIIYDHADFRLMSRRAIDALSQYSEANIFLRGMVPQIGFSHTIVYYERAERAAGESKYPLRKMLSFAIEGITSFSTKPLKWVGALGLLVCLLSFVLTGWVLFIRFFTDMSIPGWTSTIVPILFFSGVQLLCLSVLGIYLGKIYMEVKSRPRFFTDETV